MQVITRNLTNMSTNVIPGEEFMAMTCHFSDRQFETLKEAVKWWVDNKLPSNQMINLEE